MCLHLLLLLNQAGSLRYEVICSITSYYYIIITLLLHQSLLRVNTVELLCIITSLLHHYYIINTSSLRHHYVIITKGKSCNNDCIITCYANGMPPFLPHYYELADEQLLYHDNNNYICLSKGYTEMC